ncbi:MAG TPA: hypothetical protein HA282_06080 [Nanoarchaeota archaeon]|nr:MAG: hypothetical protein QT01_C0001G0022 [archaeon GW2011_AR6]HIH17680.1 hypothetical protein [Nanoarchaeota archaeon]HIH33649.1 hypothetical protein [Nanoarchaeota archaeon]HIH51684.1 hypothetical protein [Nanoarchaeota archaeon]HIH66745.1 hypothetical protein [Nanoarchaeota archaeon]
MAIDFKIGSASAGVLFVGLFFYFFGTTQGFPALVALGTTLAIIGGVIVGIFVLLSIFRNFASL